MDSGPVWNISTQIAKRNVIVMNGWLVWPLKKLDLSSWKLTFEAKMFECFHYISNIHPDLLTNVMGIKWNAVYKTLGHSNFEKFSSLSIVPHIFSKYLTMYVFVVSC